MDTPEVEKCDAGAICLVLFFWLNVITELASDISRRDESKNHQVTISDSSPPLYDQVVVTITLLRVNVEKRTPKVL